MYFNIMKVGYYMENEMGFRFKKFIILILCFSPFVYFITSNSFSFLNLIGVYLIIVVLLLIIFRVSLISFVGNLNYAKGNIEMANKLYKIAISKNTKSPTVYLNYAICLLQEGNSKEALSLLKKAQSINTKIMTEKNILVTMASCFWVMGEIDKAIEILENMRYKHEYINSNALTTLGYMYFLKGDYKQAIEFTNKAIEEDPKCGAAWDNLGQIYYKNLELEKAEDAFKKALFYRNDLVDSNYYLGLLYEKKGDNIKAKEYFIKANNCHITALNSVTKEQILDMYNKYI